MAAAGGQLKKMRPVMIPLLCIHLLCWVHQVELVSVEWIKIPSIIEDPEGVECDTQPPESIFRNGIGDDSFFTWSDKRIPFVIGEGFNETHRANILDAVADYNHIFRGCLTWAPRSDEVSQRSTQLYQNCKETTVFFSNM